MVYLSPPILDDCLNDWNLKIWVDGRIIANTTDQSAEKVLREFFVFQIPLKVGRTRMMGILRFGKLVSFMQLVELTGQATTDVTADVHLNVPESEVGTIKLSIEAGSEGAECRPYTELHTPEVGVADEERTKRFVISRG